MQTQEHDTIIESSPIAVNKDQLPQHQVQGTLPAAVTPADLLLHALNSGADLDRLERLMALKERYDENEAKKAFNVAKAAFVAENVIVIRDKENKQYKSTYASLGNMVATAAPFLSKHGLSADWKIDQSDAPNIKVTCILSHVLGHSDSVELIVPPDLAGAKNTIQQIKSAITYAKSVTYESVCGLATADANADDDGNGTTAELRGLAAEMRQATKRKMGATGLAQAKAAITAGTYTLEEIEATHELTAEQRAELAGAK